MSDAEASLQNHGLVDGPLSPIKPPLGVRPRWLVRDQRRKEIITAIERYNDAKMTVPREWLLELKGLDREDCPR